LKRNSICCPSHFIGQLTFDERAKAEVVVRARESIKIFIGSPGKNYSWAINIQRSDL
jgi:hypothetical protein